jgi:hypothetical protein
MNMYTKAECDSLNKMLWRINVFCYFLNRKCDRKSVLKTKCPTRARKDCDEMLKFHLDDLNGKGF